MDNLLSEPTPNDCRQSVIDRNNLAVIQMQWYGNYRRAIKNLSTALDLANSNKMESRTLRGVDLWGSNSSLSSLESEDEYIPPSPSNYIDQNMTMFTESDPDTEIATRNLSRARRRSRGERRLRKKRGEQNRASCADSDSTLDCTAPCGRGRVGGVLLSRECFRALPCS